MSVKYVATYLEIQLELTGMNKSTDASIIKTRGAQK